MSVLFTQGQFMTELDTRQLNRSMRRLHAPLWYHDPVHGDIVVPAGFDTDFASVKAVRTIAVQALIAAAVLLLASCAQWLPRLAAWLPWEALAYVAALVGMLALALYATVVGYCNLAGTVHDWLYQTGALTRAEADHVLARASRAEGNAKWRTLLFWLGVRLGGASHYKKS